MMKDDSILFLPFRESTIPKTTAMIMTAAITTFFRVDHLSVEKKYHFVVVGTCRRVLIFPVPTVDISTKGREIFSPLSFVGDIYLFV